MKEQAQPKEIVVADVLNWEDTGLAIVKPEVPSELQRFKTNILKTANAHEITDDESYEYAFAARREINRVYNIIEEIHNKHCKRLHAAHREATKDRDEDLSPLAEADKILERKRIEWADHREALRLEEERKVREIAQEQRQNDAVQEAAALERVGEHEAAEEIVQQAMTAPPPTIVIPSSTPKSTGSVAKVNYKYRIVDESKIPRNYMTPDHKAIGAAVRTQGKKTSIDGVEVYTDKSENVRL